MWNYVAVALVLILMTLCYSRLFRSRFAKVRKVRAQLVEKYTYVPRIQRYPVDFDNKICVLVFETEKGRLSFNVPEFSYGGYKLKKKGTLKYKGDKILEFK